MAAFFIGMTIFCFIVFGLPELLIILTKVEETREELEHDHDDI